MSPRSLFNIVLKLFGVILVKDILLTVPSLFAVFTFWGRDSSFAFTPFAYLLLTLLLFGWMAWKLLLRTNQVIDLFKLDKDFPEEQLAINFHRSSVLSIAIIIIGGIMVVNAIPDLLKQLYTYWESRQDNAFTQYSTAQLVEVMGTALKLVSGLLCLGYTRTIVNYIELRRKN